MLTEENIVYQLLDTIRGSQINNDEPIDEREIRALMATKRASIISQATYNGIMITDTEFQSLGIVSLVDTSGVYSYDIPDFYRLENFYGIRVTTATGYIVPIMTYQDFLMNKTNPVSKYLPLGYMKANVLYIYEGAVPESSINNGSQITTAIDEIKTNKEVFIELVLRDVNDAANYDWTTSQYPLSANLINKMKDDILRRDLQINVMAKVDEVANIKRDTIRYHDQNKID